MSEKVINKISVANPTGLGLFGLIEMGVVLTLLVIGFVYVWKRGALEWE